ncbi:MAG: tRNA (adenosine(37)-N6)-dimethylallyltransferase MiaA [Candidatus Omnitrophica bacterium]|nr:tRNA (adenosine(37)-N6)-dimethylallyltransferase MiaA [Candidatus Omnitrophota bacterium]MBI5144955.1 tRNA (adenosine(37)-N6)-dimethylallyltransferase MiaA [Candidatus Omnitrophota bacterium]
MQKSKIFFLVGPTATGKSETAVYLAKKLKAEIVSCDSMQVYKKMDIITSAPSRQIIKKVRHHLLGIIPPEKEYDVSRYRRQAAKKIKEIIHRNKTPLFVGGTGLYMSILIDGIFKAKAQDESLRRRLYQQAQRLGSNYLHKRLNRFDPLAAKKIHPHDTRRIVRALEVFETTGKPISQLQKERKGLGNNYEIKIFCLNMPRDKLYQRIKERIEKMFKQGLLDEVKKLLRLKLSRTAHQAIGIKELKGYFTGQYDLAEAKRLMKHNTCLYAKRQLTWFRKDKRIKWIEAKQQDTPKAIATRIFSKI